MTDERPEQAADPPDTSGELESEHDKESEGPPRELVGGSEPAQNRGALQSVLRRLFGRR